MAAAAEATHPAKQGLIQALSIYLSIFIVCTISGLVILLSGIYNVVDESTGAMLAQGAPNLEQGALWVQTALNNLTPNTIPWEGQILSVIIALFASDIMTRSRAMSGIYSEMWEHWDEQSYALLF